MGSIWVQLLSDRQIDSKAYARGSWVEVGKQTALRWIAEGTALARAVEKVVVGPDCGIVALGEEGALKVWLARYGLQCQVRPADPLRAPELPWPRTLFWDGRLKLRADLLGAGYGFLDRWELAVPLVDHTTLALEVGSPAERERTAAVLCDLRVPVYQTGVIFARDCPAARAVLAAWHAERRQGDERLAFLRALWQVKPLVLALPGTWVE